MNLKELEDQLSILRGGAGARDDTEVEMEIGIEDSEEIVRVEIQNVIYDSESERVRLSDYIPEEEDEDEEEDDEEVGDIDDRGFPDEIE